jgi:hypothetical protein
VRLPVPGDVDAEGPLADAYLRRGQTDARRRCPHRVDEIGGEGTRRVVDRADGDGATLEGALGYLHHGTDGHFRRLLGI